MTCVFPVQSDSNDLGLSSRLRTSLKRINDNLIVTEDSLQGGDERRDRVAHPHLSPIVDLTPHHGLCGLGERVVATESL